MYLFERFSWSCLTQSDEVRAKNDAMMAARESTTRQRLTDSSNQSDSQSIPLNESASECPTDANSLYLCNDRFIDVRASFQEDKRGVITFFFLAVMLCLNMFAWLGMVYTPFSIFFNGSLYVSPYDLGTLLFGVLASVLWLVMNYFMWRFGWGWVRAELFTHRHIVARFNHVTRQVHLNRPKYAGGVITLPWDAVIAAVSPTDEEYTGIGGVLVLGFMSEQTGAGYDEMMMLGRPMSGNAELVGFWEYIRRYMEEGPESVPQPKRLLKLHPLTLEPLHAALRFMSFSWRNGSRLTTIIAVTLLSPLIALLAFCHWVSLLLCHQPRWPKIIEEAGRPGKPVPRSTVAEDFGTEIGTRLRANSAKDRLDSPLPPFKRRSFKDKKVD
ncbi:hypothetical protein NPS29_28620 [Pseudomonas putida]|uniref:DUF6708 domain-containing protein n=1 Tax=Pseudomonas putida TaxID=303 RepID=UPI002363DAFC|nr:DUF6708 domain-containing protein [Pseudomonas putida]MDD1969307.1 hypothetical protein [Pseudomonas putida]